MKIYLVICCKVHGDSWVVSVFDKKEDAELEVEIMDSQLTNHNHHSYYIQEWRVK